MPFIFAALLLSFGFSMMLAVVWRTAANYQRLGLTFGAFLVVFVPLFWVAQLPAEALMALGMAGGILGVLFCLVEYVLRRFERKIAGTPRFPQTDESKQHSHRERRTV